MKLISDQDGVTTRSSQPATSDQSIWGPEMLSVHLEPLRQARAAIETISNLTDGHPINADRRDRIWALATVAVSLLNAASDNFLRGSSPLPESARATDGGNTDDVRSGGDSLPAPVCEECGGTGKVAGPVWNEHRTEFTSIEQNCPRNCPVPEAKP